MNILAVDTTSENMVIALSKNDEIFSRIGNAESKRHNSLILPMIDEVLEEAKIALGDVDYFACVVGPGSFTGIRIGVSSVNALAFALSKKCVSITALEELAFGNNYKDFYCAIDCRHDNFYYARFDTDYTNIIEMGEITLQELEKKDKVIVKDKPSDPKALIEIAKYKINANKFEILAPLYLKKSQAEREYDNKNMDKIG
ncbi:MAG: tRNA (adenosine(37)-N6)-threonylcarbamoyltransferase complex dimerization subunit type 1 TsaB [Clostridia bacterium]|nr:tRNA (adenosine(37)-N6)-threonylcarbamoyltransferase complex dimerization subunit type 1 TsaB [Clostridia bacterium]